MSIADCDICFDTYDGYKWPCPIPSCASSKNVCSKCIDHIRNASHTPKCAFCRSTLKRQCGICHNDFISLRQSKCRTYSCRTKPKHQICTDCFTSCSKKDNCVFCDTPYIIADFGKQKIYNIPRYGDIISNTYLDLETPAPQAFDSTYFDMVQPYYVDGRNDRNSSSGGSYIYSYALRPEEYQPSRTVNMSYM